MSEHRVRVRVEESVSLEARTQAIGRELLARAKQAHAHLSSLNRWTTQLLRWCLADPHVKSQVLRFLDCLPSLTTPRAVVRHLREYFPADGWRLPAALRLGVSLTRPGLLTAPAVSFMVHQLVEQVAQQFIAGARAEDAVSVMQRLASRGVRVSFDVLGEQVTSEAEADRYARQYVELISRLGAAGHVSVKPSALTAQFDPLSVRESAARALGRLRLIAQRAVEVGAAVTLDMEQVEYRELTLELAKQLLQEPGLGERVRLGVVVQAYVSDAEQAVTDLLDWLAQHRRRLAVRLVKGAYWDYEVAHALQMGWAVPVHRRKWQTDRTFERLTERLLASSSMVRPEIASHNLRSIAHAMAVAEELKLPKDTVEFQLLYGMGDAIQAAVASLGWPVRVYAPVGELIPGMAYLVRRILENTANESFLLQDFLETASADTLMAPPGPNGGSHG
ncbi:MAG: proline dehydrogenase family protein [Candidatus Omnitrophica bacterium]|nr:proline dehydrogenase family protein [Candidatus Omnitrophota bacterium]